MCVYNLNLTFKKKINTVSFISHIKVFKLIFPQLPVRLKALKFKKWWL